MEQASACFLSDQVPMMGHFPLKRKPHQICIPSQLPQIDALPETPLLSPDPPLVPASEVHLCATELRSVLALGSGFKVRERTAWKQESHGAFHVCSEHPLLREPC